MPNERPPATTPGQTGWTGAEWFTAPDGTRLLFLGSDLDARGKVRYSFSIWPGVVAVLTTTPGPRMPGPDDPAILAEAAHIRRTYATHT